MNATFIPTDARIEEEVEFYIATNGEIGAWGEPMRDETGVECICNLLEDNSYTITKEVKDRVRKALIK